MSTDVFLAIIAGGDTDGLIEVRCRSPRTGRIEARDWFPVDAREDCQQFISSHAPTLDVYVGVCPRARREGGKSAIRRGWCVWADIDTVEGLARLRRFQPRPTLVIRSGTGENVHAYWSLSEPLPPAWIERANRRLAYALGADMKATDSARILRPPATLNHKHEPPARVTIARGPTASQVSSYSVVAVCKNLADPPRYPPVRELRTFSVLSDDPLLGVSADVFYERLTGRQVTRGNVTCPFSSHRGGTEKSPSMRLYDRTFYCFGCGVGGSVIQFAAHLWGYADTRGQNYRDIRERLTDVLS